MGAFTEGCVQLRTEYGRFLAAVCERPQPQKYADEYATVRKIRHTRYVTVRKCTRIWFSSLYATVNDIYKNWNVIVWKCSWINSVTSSDKQLSNLIKGQH